MNNIKRSKSDRFLAYLGKILCVGIGAFAGFVVAGPLAACLGALAGIICGFLLEKSIQKSPV